MTSPSGPSVEITIRIDRLVVETEHAVDAAALRRALAGAVRAVVDERGVPPAWHRAARTPVAVIDGFTWDGHGGEPGLARALAARIYDEALTTGAPA